MYLHGLDILHGGISPVGEAKDWVNPHADAWSVQNNILIARDGQACLGDFAIAGAYQYPLQFHQPETLRYMAPERVVEHTFGSFIVGPSKGSDVYSFAMTSFSVCTSFGNHPTTQYNEPVTIRSSRGYYRFMEVIWRT